MELKPLNDRVLVLRIDEKGLLTYTMCPGYK